MTSTPINFKVDFFLCLTNLSMIYCLQANNYQLLHIQQHGKMTSFQT